VAFVWFLSFIVCAESWVCTIDVDKCTAPCFNCCKELSSVHCQLCVSTYCRPAESAAPVPPPKKPTPPPTLPPIASLPCNVEKCSVCPRCCKPYLTDAESCTRCVEQMCSASDITKNGFTCAPSNGPCDVCPSCCKEYLVDSVYCSKCVEQKCNLLDPTQEKAVCNSQVGCTACPSCCIPGLGAKGCDECVSKHCGKEEPPLICNPTIGCSVCAKCCRSYIRSYDDCSSCNSTECVPPPPAPSPGPSPVPQLIRSCNPNSSLGCLNVCSACCAEYLDGPQCASCVREECGVGQ